MSWSGRKQAAVGVGQPPRRLVRRRTLTGGDPQKGLTGSALTTGKLLSVFADHAVHRAIKSVGRPVVPPGLRRMRVGSACSGSEMASVAAHALANALSAEGLDISFDTVCTCELDHQKRASCQ